MVAILEKSLLVTLAKGVFLQEGTHAVSISGGVPGVQFYGFRVCSGFSEYPLPVKPALCSLPGGSRM